MERLAFSELLRINERAPGEEARDDAVSVERERYCRLLEGTGAAGGSGPRDGGIAGSGWGVAVARRAPTDALLPASSAALALEETLSPAVGSFFGQAVASGVPAGGSRAPVVGRKFRRLCVVLFPGEFWASLSGDAARLICTSLFVTRLLFDCRG